MLLLLLVPCLLNKLISVLEQRIDRSSAAIEHSYFIQEVAEAGITTPVCRHTYVTGHTQGGGTWVF